MTGNNIKHNILRKASAGLAVLFAVVFFYTDVMATPSTQLFIGSTLPECTANKQKRGGGSCLERQNAKSCINTTPFSPVGGVSSEMCARGEEWCDRNDPRPAKHDRCKKVYAGGEAKNHQGYDYSAACGSSIFAPCDGDSVYNASSSTHPIKFTCEICGKKYEYTFHHTQGTVGNGHYKKGALIGFSGNATGYPCHMHIEIRQNGRLMDPMYSGFDEEVCSCMDTPKVNREDCFDSTSVASKDTTPAETGYQYDATNDAALRNATLNNANNTKDGSVDENCIYANVQAKFASKGCFFCTPFRIMFDTASVIAKVSFDTLSRSVYIVVMIAFAIWLSITIMRFVSHFEIRDPRNMIKILLHQSFKVLFVVILLVGAPQGGNMLSHLLDMTVNPVFSTGLKIAQLGGGLVSGNPEETCGIGTDATDTPGVTKDGALSTQMGNGILCTIKNIQDKIMDIMAIARVSWCLSWEYCLLKRIGIANFCLLFPHLGYFVTAIGFFVTSFMLLVIYPWLLVDSVLRLAVATALLPAAVGAWAFKPTSQYIKKVLGTFLDAVFTFIFLSIIILIIAVIAKSYATDILNPYTERGVFVGKIMWWGVAACKMMFVCLLGWAVLHEAKEFASKFTKSIADSAGGQMDIGSKVGAAAGGVTKGIAKETVFPVAHQIGAFGANATRENLSHFGRRAKKWLKDNYGGGGDSGGDDDFDDADDSINIHGGKKSSAFNEQGGEEKFVPFKKFGTKVYSTLHNARRGAAKINNAFLDKVHVKEDSWLGRRWVVQDLNKLNDSLHSHPGENTFQQDADGNIMQTNTVSFADGSQIITKKDDFATMRVHRTADGKETVFSARLNNSTQKIVKNRRKIDQSRLQAIQQSGMWKDEEKAMIVMSSIVDSRMGSYTGGRLDGDIKSREITQGVSDSGAYVITINQVNADGSKTTFSASIVGDLARNSVETVYKNGDTISYTTDGTIQRITEVTDGKKRETYSVDSHFANRTDKPIHLDGTVSDVLGANNILFSKEELQDFAKQVEQKGFKSAFRSFTSFKNS